jgi:hemerythrin-like domain-containing protein
VALAFQRLWHFYIVEHHNSEDHVFWPWMHHNVPALKPTLDALEPEHQALFDLHDKIDHILKTPTSNVTGADVDRLEELLKHLKSFLQQHFQKEEETICSALAYSLSREQQDDLKRIMKEAGRQSPHAKDRLCAYADLAAADANVREKFEAKFPWILRWVLIPLLWTPKYRQAELVFVP